MWWKVKEKEVASQVVVSRVVIRNFWPSPWTGEMGMVGGQRKG